MNTNAKLEAIHSLRDKNGNCYFAFRYTDYNCRKVVEGLISGGESNISAIRCYTGKKYEYDSSIIFDVIPMSIRNFNRITKGWKYFGCKPEEIANKIKLELAN